MTRTKLTPFSKLLITLLIVGGVGYGLYRISENPEFLERREQEKSDTKGSSDVINIGVVTWGGYAGGQYFNEGFQANTNSRYYKEYGFKVNFEVLDDFDASREAFKNGNIDLLWATIDALPTEMEGLGNFDPRLRPTIARTLAGQVGGTEATKFA